MELQQRSDTRVFFKHYFHPHEEEIQQGLEYGAAPSPFKKQKSTAAEDAVVVSVESPGQGAITEEPEPTTRASSSRAAAGASNMNSADNADASSNKSMTTEAKPVSLLAAKAKSAPAPSGSQQQHHAYVSRNACRQARRKQSKKQTEVEWRS